MPSKSLSEHNLMEAAAHNPAVAAKRGISQDAAREIVSADKGRDLSKLPKHVASAGPHKDPDADQRGGRSDMDADDTRKPPRHHSTHDMPMRTPPRQHGSHDMPTKPGKARAGY